MKCAEDAGLVGLEALGWLMKRLRCRAGKRNALLSSKRAHGRFSGQMKRFLELPFLVVRRDEAQVTECWCPDEAASAGLV